MGKNCVDLCMDDLQPSDLSLDTWNDPRPHSPVTMLQAVIKSTLKQPPHDCTSTVHHDPATQQ